MVEHAVVNEAGLIDFCAVFGFLQRFLSFQSTAFAKTQSSSPSSQPAFCSHVDLSWLTLRRVLIWFLPLLDSFCTD